MYMHCLHSLFCQLPNCNLFSQHVIYLYKETPLVNCGPRSILLYSYYHLLFTSFIYFLANNYLLPHDTFNPLFTTNRWDWQPHCKLGQSTLVVLCAGSTLLLVQSYAPDNAPSINCLEQSPSQLASTFRSWFFLLLVRLNLGLIPREDLPLCSSYLPLGVPNWAASTAISGLFIKMLCVGGFWSEMVSMDRKVCISRKHGY
jgi:hypothetical protein